MKEKELKNYMEINGMAESGGVVFLGSDYFAGLPVGELAQVFHLDVPVYNRSLEHLTIKKIIEELEVCVYELCPDKVFVNIGDADILDNSLDIDEFISNYEWLLYSIHAKTKASLYIVSILSEKLVAQKINLRLRKLAEQNGLQYIDITSALEADKQDLRVFDLMKFYVKRHPLRFSEAMSLPLSM